MKVNRAYSISSSPKNAKEGFYELTIKSVGGGLVSNYVFDHWKVGDEAEISGPTGFFTYSPIRDAKTVIGIAGGSGITPFLSMARALADGDEAFNLVLLYGSRKADMILYKEAFDALEAKSDKIKVVHVLSDEKAEGYEHGFVTAEIIKKYAPSNEPSSAGLRPCTHLPIRNWRRWNLNGSTSVTSSLARSIIPLPWPIIRAVTRRR